MWHRLNQRFDNWIFHGFPIDPESLAIYRIVYALYFLLFGIPSFVWLAAYPEVFYNPPLSLASLFSRFPNYAVLQTLSTVVCVLLVLLLFGYRTPLVSVLLSVMLVIGYSFKYAFGKIDHDLLPLLIPSIMAFSGWGTRFSLDAVSAPQRDPSPAHESCANWPVALVAFLLALGFFSAGAPKLIGWIDFDLSTHGVRGWALRRYYVSEQHELLVPLFASISNPYFWEALDILAVTFELGFLVVVLFPKVFRAYLGLAVLFHFTNFWLLQIVNFTEFVLIYLLFINWTPIRAYLLDHTIFTELWKRLRPQHVLLTMGLVLALYYIGQVADSTFPVDAVSPLSICSAWFNLDFSQVKNFLVLTLAAGITCYFAFLKVRQVFTTS
jgi:hypothetical protein